jgi:hypothetical protein
MSNVVAFPREPVRPIRIGIQPDPDDAVFLDAVARAWAILERPIKSNRHVEIALRDLRQILGTSDLLEAFERKFKGDGALPPTE